MTKLMEKTVVLAIAFCFSPFFDLHAQQIELNNSEKNHLFKLLRDKKREKAVKLVRKKISLDESNFCVIAIDTVGMTDLLKKKGRSDNHFKIYKKFNVLLENKLVQFPHIAAIDPLKYLAVKDTGGFRYFEANILPPNRGHLIYLRFDNDDENGMGYIADYFSLSNKHRKFLDSFMYLAISGILLLKSERSYDNYIDSKFHDKDLLNRYKWYRGFALGSLALSIYSATVYENSNWKKPTGWIDFPINILWGAGKRLFVKIFK